MPRGPPARLGVGDLVAVNAYWFDSARSNIAPEERWSFQTFGAAKWRTATCKGVVVGRGGKGKHKKDSDMLSIAFDTMDDTGNLETHAFKRKNIRLLRSAEKQAEKQAATTGEQPKKTAKP